MSLYFACQISNCGQLLCLVPQQSGTAPSGGYDQLVVIGSVSGTPTLHKNGSSCAIGPATWDEGTNGQGPGSLVAFLITAGPVLPTDTMTVDIPANFINGNSPAYTAVAVTNNTGRIEKTFGAGVVTGATGCPGLDFTPTTGAAANPGHPMVGNYCANFLPWNQCLRAVGWSFAPGSGGAFNADVNGVPVSWTAGQTLRLTGWESSFLYDIGGGDGNGLDTRGYPNQIGKWTLVWDDSEAGTPNASSVTLINDGSVAPGASCTLFSSSTIGTTTTAVYDVQYTSSTPSAWDVCLTPHLSAPANNTGGSDGLSHYAISNLWLSPPNMADGTAMTVVRTNPFAINPNVRTQLTGGGKVIENLRCMESMLGGGSLNNYIYECDAPNINGYWAQQRVITLYANHVRYCNTDPAKGPGPTGDGTYAWLSTKVYGPQADFALSDGGSVTVTATLTAGSINIALTSGQLTLAGGHVTGAGISSGTRLAYFALGGTTSAVLSKPATSSGTVTLTIANPGYLPLAAGDNGGFIADGFGPQNWTVAEFRTDGNHGLTTGQYPGGNTNPHNNAVAVTGGLGTVGVGFGYTRIWVTGPDTFVSAWSTGGGTGNSIQTIVQTTEYDFTNTGTDNNGAPDHGIIVEVDVPYDAAGTLPMEAMAAMCVDLGCNCYVNIPSFATDELLTAYGTKAHAYGGSTIHFRLENEDEPWNSGSTFATNVLSNLARQNLYGYTPNGTVISSYYTSTGQPLPFNYDGMGVNVLLSGHTGDVFTAAFVAAGGSSSRVERVIGTQWSYPTGPTNVNAGALQQWGVPCDWLVIGPYLDTPGSNSIATAFGVSGGNWPMGAINDFIRLYHLWNYTEQNYYFNHLQPLLTWGQPVQQAQFTDAGNLGGNFAPFGGGYVGYYTFLDVHGNETTVGQSASVPEGFNQHDAGQFVIPPCPPWVKSVNFYVAGPGASPNDGTERLYANYPLATYPTGTTIIMTSTPPGVTPPPTTNGAAASAGTPPKLAAYEGGDQKPIQTNTVDWAQITHDVIAHPSRWLNVYTWFASGQIGCQWLPGSGLHWMNYYGVWDQPGPNPHGGNDTWIIYGGIHQVPGQGLNNQYALKGAPADGHDHNPGAPLASGFNGVQVANQSPSGWGLQQWLAGGPAAAPSLTVSPSSASATDGVTTVSITATLANSTASLTASVSGGGTISTTTPTSGTPFTYTPPSSGSGTATVTVTDSTDSLSGQCTITYGPAATLAVNPATAATHYGGATVSITATLTGSAAALTASVSGGGTISTTSPTSGTPFTYTPPATGSGTTTATVTVTDSTDSLTQHCIVTLTPAPALVVSPTSASVADGGTQPITATLSNSAASLTASLTGGGSISTATPTSGTPFTYTAPASGTGSAVVTVTDAADNLTATCTLSYGPSGPAPTVTSTTPASGATLVAANSTVTVVFSEAMNSSTLGLTLNNASIPFTSYNAGTFTAVFTPPSLANGTTYTAVVNGSSSGAVAMASPYSWTFTTVDAVPTVTATNPTNGATLVSTTAKPTATFNEAVNSGSIAFTVTPQGGSAIAGTTSYAASTHVATFAPASALSLSTTYTASISANAPDGTPMGSAYTWTFTTHGTPPTGGGLILPLGYGFTQAVNVSSMTVTLTQNGSSVPGSASYDSTQFLVTFTPNAPLTPGSRYLLTIAGLKTMGGTSIPTIKYPITPGTQRSSGWVGGVGTATGGIA